MDFSESRRTTAKPPKDCDDVKMRPRSIICGSIAASLARRNTAKHKATACASAHRLTLTEADCAEPSMAVTDPRRDMRAAPRSIALDPRRAGVGRGEGRGARKGGYTSNPEALVRRQRTLDHRQGRRNGKEECSIASSHTKGRSSPAPRPCDWHASPYAQHPVGRHENSRGKAQRPQQKSRPLRGLRCRRNGREKKVLG